MEDGKTVAILILDQSAAFDVCDHPILEAKLQILLELVDGSHQLADGSTHISRTGSNVPWWRDKCHHPFEFQHAASSKEAVELGFCIQFGPVTCLTVSTLILVIIRNHKPTVKRMAT